MTTALHEGTVRVGVAVVIPALIEALGQDAAEVFEQAGMDITLFDDPDNVIPYAARGHLIRVCVSRTGCEHFGLLIGQHGSLSSFGLIGFLAQQSPDIGSALKALARYFHLHVQGARIELTRNGPQACLDYQIYEQGVEAMGQIEDGAMAWAVNIMRELCGKDFSPGEVRFLHRAPRDLTPYRRLFRAPVLFGSETAGMYFPSRLLERPLHNVDPDLHRLLQKEVTRLQSRYRGDFLDNFERVLHSVLWVKPVTADEVAALFSISRRTLNRRLNSLGTTYSQVTDQVKQQIACHILCDSEMSLVELAELLHYADASSFIKAFRRWTGMTPNQWRNKNCQS